jgi:hypothetical protein
MFETFIEFNESASEKGWTPAMEEKLVNGSKVLKNLIHLECAYLGVPEGNELTLRMQGPDSVLDDIEFSIYVITDGMTLFFPRRYQINRVIINLDESGKDIKSEIKMSQGEKYLYISCPPDKIGLCGKIIEKHYLEDINVNTLDNTYSGNALSDDDIKKIKKYFIGEIMNRLNSDVEFKKASHSDNILKTLDAIPDLYSAISTRRALKFSEYPGISKEQKDILLLMSRKNRFL